MTLPAGLPLLLGGSSPEPDAPSYLGSPTGSVVGSLIESSFIQVGIGATGGLTFPTTTGGLFIASQPLSA